MSVRIALRLAAILLGAVGGLLIAEVIARQVLGPPPASVERALFFSEPSWRVWPDGTIRYAPNAAIRTAALYGGRVEYDVEFETNDFGLVDSRDYGPDVGAPSPGRTRVALVGDSFTAGFHGGAPWLPPLAARLADRPDGPVLYNLGVGATGVVQFADLAVALDDALDFDRVILLGITSDLHRPAFRPLFEHDRIHLCRMEWSGEECIARDQPLFVIARDAPIDQLRAWAEGRARPPPSRPGMDWRGRLARASQVGARLLGASAVLTSVDRRPLPDSARGSLGRLAARFAGRPIEWWHIPQKHEVMRRRLDLDPSAEMRALGIGHRSLLERCPWRTRDFHAVDAHLDAGGYERFSACVESQLEAGSP